MAKRELTPAEIRLLKDDLKRYCHHTDAVAIVVGAEPPDRAYEAAAKNLRNALAGGRTDGDFLTDVCRAAVLLLEEVGADKRALLAYHSARVSEVLDELDRMADARAAALAELSAAVTDLPGPTGGVKPFDWFAREHSAEGLVPLSMAPALHVRRPGPRPGPIPHRVQDIRRPALERARERFDRGEG